MTTQAQFKHRALVHYTAMAAQAEFEALVSAVEARHQKPNFSSMLDDIRAIDDDDAMRAADEAAADWIKWTGNLGCPVPAGTHIEVRDRDGWEHEVLRPELSRWLHSGQDGLGIDPVERDCDIVAYRVMA
jgi:hypothetical protein